MLTVKRKLVSFGMTYTMGDTVARMMNTHRMSVCNQKRRISSLDLTLVAVPVSNIGQPTVPVYVLATATVTASVQRLEPQVIRDLSVE